MNESVREEIEVLTSIYGDDAISIEPGAGDDIHQLTYTDASDGFKAIFQLPHEYPSSCGPSLMLSFDRKIDPDVRQSILAAVESLIADRVEEEVVLFSCIQLLKERIEEARSLETVADNSGSSNDEINEAATVFDSLISNSATKAIVKVHVVHGPFMTEKKSIFQSHLAAVSNMDEVAAFKAQVYEDRKVASATHNIFAYRFSCRTSGVLYHDYDDDGETAAGGRLAEMMRLMSAEGVAVIVTRWFGGILLGPDRFKLICNSARQLLEENGYSKRMKGSG